MNSRSDSLSRFSITLVIYLLLSSYFPRSYIPGIISAVLMASILYKGNFPWLVKKFINTEISSQRQALVDAVVTLQHYETASLAWNEKKRRNLKFVGWEGKQQAQKLGYLRHIDAVDAGIKKNALLARDIANTAIQNHALNDVDLKTGGLKTNSRAIEAITHYARDWTSMSSELDPLLKFVKDSVDKFVKVKSKTLVVVPGSGLGRIAHEVANMGVAKVVTVEFSGLMYLCNEFVYGSKDSYDIYPFLHSYSHHTTAANHTRHVKFTRHSKPDNLDLTFGDFREFQVPDGDYDQVVVISAFFMDTAQNMFDYFQAIETVMGEKKGLWINVGPLKYGSAPFVEFTLEELRDLRTIRGWKDVAEPPAGELAGYLTDTRGLWQGFYGLGKWVSTRNC